MASTTPLGLTVLAHGENTSANGHAFTSKDPLLVDRLLRQLMDHRHTGGTPAAEVAPDPPDLLELATEGSLLPGTTYYYRIAEMRGGLIPFESPASASVWVTTSAGLTAPEITAADLTVVTTGGALAPGFYQYAATVYDTFYTYDTNCPSPVSVMLSPGDGDEQQVEIDLPLLPDGADGWNIYRRVPNGLSFQLIDTLVGDPVGPFVDDGSLVESSRTLPTRDLSAWKRTVSITRPVAVTGDWVVYRSRDDADWNGTLIATVDSLTDAIDDTGLPADFLAPHESFSPYWEPQRIRGDEVVETAQVVQFSDPGTAATGPMTGEWVCPYTEARMVSLTASLAAGTSPVTQDLIFDVEKWDGVSAWDVLFAASIDAAVDTETSVVSPVEALVAGDRLRVNVTQVGDGTDQDLTVQFHLWAHPGWTAVTWDEPV